VTQTGMAHSARRPHSSGRSLVAVLTVCISAGALVGASLLRSNPSAAQASPTPQVSPTPTTSLESDANAPAMTPQFPLSTANDALLKWAGIVMSPTTTLPQVPLADIESTIVRHRPDVQFREAALARVQEMSTPPVDCTCWVVSVVPRPGRPSGGPPDHPIPPQSSKAVDLYFFDASSGSFLFEEGGDPVQGG
jgi:hypothetical protein